MCTWLVRTVRILLPGALKSLTFCSADELFRGLRFPLGKVLGWSSLTSFPGQDSATKNYFSIALKLLESQKSTQGFSRRSLLHFQATLRRVAPIK